jgi:hypothetical protein
MMNQQRTTAIKFGKWAVALVDCQLHYFSDKSLVKVRDVHPTFDKNDLYELVVKIAAKEEIPESSFIFVDHENLWK